MSIKDDLTVPGLNLTKRALGTLALLGFLASMTVHVLTFVPGFAVTMHSPIWLLHVGIFPPFVALVFALRAEMKGVPPAEAKRHFLGLLPRWGKALFLVAFYYALVNFGLFMLRTGGASAERSGSGYVLTSHGRVVRHVTKEEALENEAQTTRGFSGHWMAFYLLPALYFLTRRQPGRQGPPGLVR